MDIGGKPCLLKNYFRFLRFVILPMKLLACLFIFICFTDQVRADNPDYKRAIQLKEKGQWNEALEIFKTLLASDSNNVSYLQETASLLLKTGYLSGNETVKRKNYFTAEYLILKALDIEPGNITSHFLYLAALGRITEISSNMEKLRMVKKIRSECDFILSQDSTHGATWHILGRWHRELAALSPFERWMIQQIIGKIKGGTFDDALFCFYKAIRYAPSDVSHYYETARTLTMRNKSGDKKAAVNWLTKGLALPANPNNADELHFRDLMEKLLRQLN